MPPQIFFILTFGSIFKAVFFKTAIPSEKFFGVGIISNFPIFFKSTDKATRIFVPPISKSKYIPLDILCCLLNIFFFD